MSPNTSMLRGGVHGMFPISGWARAWRGTGAYAHPPRALQPSHARVSTPATLQDTHSTPPEPLGGAMALRGARSPDSSHMCARRGKA